MISKNRSGGTPSRSASSTVSATPSVSASTQWLRTSFGALPGARLRPEVDGLADGVEHRAAALPRPRREHGERPLFGRRRRTEDRRVDELAAGQPLGRLDADRAHLRPDGVAELDVAHGGRHRVAVGQHRHDDLRAGAGLGGRVVDGGAVDRLGPLARAVPGVELVTRRDQVAAHRRAHQPGAEQGDAHQ